MKEDTVQVQKIVGDSIPLVSRKIDLPELQVLSRKLTIKLNLSD
jgi:hypothetical protein